MSPKTFVFIGRSGCGKGTQVELLQKALKEKDPTSEIFYLETGQKFRDFTASKGYTNELARAIQKDGKLQPSFLAVWMWSDILVGKLTPEKHLFIDGTPRKLGESIIFIEAMKFYSRKPVIIYLNVRREWSEERLRERHRSDDMNDIIKNRLDWFDTDVLPVIDYFKNNTDVYFLDINGERSITEIHKDILAKVQL